MNKTPNYQLSQWSRDDRVLMEDFNADNAKIDGALGDHEGRVAALEAAAPHFGNCQIWTATYQGDGTGGKNFGEDHPNSLTFPQKPIWAIVFDSENRAQFNIPSGDCSYPVGNATRHIKWNGNTVTWYADDVFTQMNWFNYTYLVIAFFAMD